MKRQLLCSLYAAGQTGLLYAAGQTGYVYAALYERGVPSAAPVAVCGGC
jgi:hypothetical protein